MTINDPRDISGLVAWYSADYEDTFYNDGDQITTLHDLSGNGNDATGAQRSVGLKPRWRSSGGSSGGPRFSFPNGNNNTTTGGWFTLPNLLSGATAGEIMATIKADAAVTSCGLWAFGAGTGANDQSHYPFSGTVYENFGLATTQRKSFVPSMAITSWRRYNVWTSAADFTARLNETNQVTTGTSVTPTWTSTPRIGVGRRNSGDDMCFNGDMGVILIYNRKLTSGERADLVTWVTANPSGGLQYVPAIPGDPTGLDVDEGVTNLELSWSASTGSPTGYDVRINGGIPIDVGNVLVHDFTGLTPATSYTLEVRAYGAGGDSGWSSIGGTTLALPAPTGLAVLGDDEDSITLTWDTHPYAEGFEVRLDGGAATDVGLTTIHIFSGLDETTLYDLEVRAYLDGFFSDWSSLESTTEGPPPVAASYTVTIKVGDHEWIITDSDVLDPSDPIHVLDALNLGWEIPESDPWPTQPQATTARLRFFATNVDELADVAIGTPMYVVLEDADANVFATFHGRLAEETAQPVKRRAGLRMLYSIVGVDYTVDLNEQPVTNTIVWPAETADERFDRIVDLAAGVGVTLTPPADTGTAAFEALDAQTRNLGPLIADHLRQIAIDGDIGPERYVVVPVMDIDGLLDHFECVILPRAVPASSLPGTFVIVAGKLTLVFADPDANGLVDAGDVDLDVSWTRLKYRAINHVVVSSDAITREAIRPGPTVRLNLDHTLTDGDAVQRMAKLYLPDTDEALGWVADTFRFYAHRAQDALLPPWFPDHREDPPNTDVFIQPIAITGIPTNINFGGAFASYAGTLANVSLTLQRRKILVDFSLRRQLAFGSGAEAASWAWAQTEFPTVDWDDIDPDLSWYEARLGKAT